MPSQTPEPTNIFLRTHPAVSTLSSLGTQISEKERENLEEARAEALALLGKERDLRTQRSALYQLSVVEARRNVAAVEKKHAELSAKLEYEKVRPSPPAASF